MNEIVITVNSHVFFNNVTLKNAYYLSYALIIFCAISVTNHIANTVYPSD